MGFAVTAVMGLLACHAPAGHATLSIDVTQPGHVISPNLFGDQVEVTDNASIWDAGAQEPYSDVVATAQNLGLTVLRYPGGTPSDFFHWAQSTGPLAGRTAQIDPFNSTTQKVVTYPPAFGPDEFAQLASTLQVDLLITANVGTGTADEAAAWLQHYQDQGVTARFWEIGNEVWINGDGYGATVPRRSPQEYATLFDQYARALRAVDPTIQVGVLGCHDSGAFSLCEVSNWNQQVLQAITEKADFMSVHNSYAPAVGEPFIAADDEDLYRATLAAPEYFKGNFALQEADVAQFASAQNQSVPLAVTEHASYFVPASDPTFVHQLERNRTLASALFSALSFNVFISDPRITLATHLKLASSYWQAAVTTSAADQHSSPVLGAYGYVFQSYAAAARGQYVPVALTCDTTFDSPAEGIVPAQNGVSALDAIAVIPGSSADALWIYVVNRDLKQDIDAAFTVTGFTTQHSWAEVLDAHEYYDTNSSEHPDVVHPVLDDLGADGRFRFPAHSFTRIRIQ